MLKERKLGITVATFKHGSIFNTVFKRLETSEMKNMRFPV